MKVITNRNEELKVKEVHTENEERLTKILLPNQIHRFIFELQDKSDTNLKEYELARFGRISVCYTCFINDTQPKEDDLELSLWDENFKSRWQIASFEKDYEDDTWMGYELVSCGQRLNDKAINYSDLGKAIHYAYEILNKYYEENYKED